MPVVHVRGTLRNASVNQLVHIAEAVAAPAGCSLGDVWCTYQQVNPATAGSRTHDILYVDLLARPREKDALQNALAAAATSASSSFHVPLEDVWARLTVLEPGTVFAGGNQL